MRCFFFYGSLSHFYFGFSEVPSLTNRRIKTQLYFKYNLKPFDFRPGNNVALPQVQLRLSINTKSVTRKESYFFYNHVIPAVITTCSEQLSQHSNSKHIARICKNNSSQRLVFTHTTLTVITKTIKSAIVGYDSFRSMILINPD